MKKDLTKLRHARSVKDFPNIDLQKDEYVELAIGRSKKGLILIWAGECAGFVALTIILILMATAGDGFLGFNNEAVSYLYMIVFALYGILIVSGIVGTYIYKNNHIYITNKRAIQQIRSNLLASSTNIIDLQSIEDVSFRKTGILDYILKLGTIRMSTVGDETTYTFPYVDAPRDEVKIITRLVSQAKEKHSK